jgi:serine protease Do
MSCRIGRHQRWIGAVASLFLVHLSCAATPTPEVQKAVRQATFEVVLPKIEGDSLSYEKPLPFELVPFVVRSDRYWSIGTAFAIGPGTFVSAGHVMLSAVGSQFGAPGLRDGSGHVYPVNQVLKFSAHEDFVVFTVSGAPPAAPLTTTTERNFDEVVFAVGNALGEGVIIRDGLLTSETPENQDGRWKWLRFSAAASPGNSGGPLLDADGRVLGVVTAKSPNENLNYALPISRVLDAGNSTAAFDIRYTVKLPNARETQVATLKAHFDLPKSFTEFAGLYRELLLNSYRRDQLQLQTALANQLFPKGKSAKLLATVYDSPLPAFVQENTNDAWDAVGPDNVSDQDLPGKALVSTGSALGVHVFRLRRPDAAYDDKFYQNSTPFMDLLLKGLKLPRVVGDQAIRVVSLGHAQKESEVKDRYGRRWQVSFWPLGYSDTYVICYALPVPEGYVGMVHVVPSTQLDVMNEYLKSLANDVYVNYAGTLAQWKAFLARRELRPSAFDNVKLDSDEKIGFRFQSARLTMQIQRDLLETSADSELEVHMAYMLDGDKLAWDIGALSLYKDQNRHTYVGLERHVKPADDSAKELMETWNRMSVHGGGYNGLAGHDEDFRNYWIHNAVSAPPSKGPSSDLPAAVLYDVFYNTESSVYPRNLEDVERRLIQSTRILEH